MTIEEISKMLGVSAQVLYAYLKEADIAVPQAARDETALLQMDLTTEQMKTLLAFLKSGKDKVAALGSQEQNKVPQKVQSKTTAAVRLQGSKTVVTFRGNKKKPISEDKGTVTQPIEAFDSVAPQQIEIQKSQDSRSDTQSQETATKSQHANIQEEEANPAAAEIAAKVNHLQDDKVAHHPTQVPDATRPSSKRGNTTSDHTDAPERTKSSRSKKSRRSSKAYDISALTEENKALRPHKSTRHKKQNKKGASNITKSTKTEHAFSKPVTPVTKNIALPESITVSELAQKMSVKGAEVIKVMMKMGAMVTINEVIDQETATIVVEEMGHVPQLVRANALEDGLLQCKRVYALKPRAPAVTIMGHVDHGKTSLLDYIRRTKVTSGEAGGITQHIGAYQVNTHKGVITFLDTPGHEAFTAMRARGAKCTDIVILMVAADDGVMPQTIEAIQHAKAAGVPMIVAINKIDKPNADPSQVTQMLTQHGVISEEWGGDVMLQPISAKTGQGVDDLLDRILLQADVLELKAPVEGSAYGVIIESRLDKRRGSVATMLVQGGTLKRGDVLLAGKEYGSVRAMIDDRGLKVDSAGPSVPVEILGLSGVATAGDEAQVLSSERKAREVALFRQGKYRGTRLKRRHPVSLEHIFETIGPDTRQVVNLILKADVQGSLEAITDALVKLSTSEVEVRLIASGVGGITQSDVHLAIASSAILMGFNVRADIAARKLAEAEDLDLRYYSVIYHLIDEVKSALSGLLKPEIKETILGLAQVREVFRSSKLGAIAGCLVIHGTIRSGNAVRVLRDNVVIFTGKLESLRRFKEDIKEVKSGVECGIGIRDYNDIKLDDQIEVYEVTHIQRVL